MDQTIHISDAFQSDKKGFLIPKSDGAPIAIDGIMTVGRDASNDIILNDLDTEFDNDESQRQHDR